MKKVFSSIGSTLGLSDSQDKTSKSDKKSSRVRKTKSLESVFSLTNKSSKPSNQSQHYGSRLTPLNGTPNGQHLFDVCAYLIVCEKHQKIAISQEETSHYIWLPFISLPTAKSWTDSARDGAYIILSNGDANAFTQLRAQPVFNHLQCLHLLRLQLPQTQVFNIRLIYYAKLNASNKSFKCCKDTKRLKWLPTNDLIQSKVSNLWGPEVVEFARLISKHIVIRILEYSLDDAFKYVPREPPRNLEEEMLKSTNYTEKDIERLYSDFIEHCFPAFFMTKTSFTDYMCKYGFEKADKKSDLLFRAFNFNKNGFLGFYEFLLGLTSIDPMATNGQSRIKFVFKYFDFDSDGFLSEKEFTLMLKEIYPNDSKEQIQKRVKDSMKIIGIKKGGVHFDDFNKAVGAHKFRGTSGICRSNRPILAEISRSMASRTMRRTTYTKSQLTSHLDDRKYKGICMSCKAKKFDYAVHTVRLVGEGSCVNYKPLPELNKIERSAKQSEQKSNILLGLTADKYSVEVVWNKKSLANYFLEHIRAFNLKKGSHKDNKGLLDGQSERGPFVKMLEQLCKKMEKIFSQEERCLSLNSPAFLIGDIHGNLEDLLTMERVLWKSIPIVSANYVFLGDYVDRGKWGLECIIYLMCFKLLAPNKVFLLRGNHEVRELQKKYSYRKECKQKYGDSLGQTVFELTNSVFDRMPLCAIIDEAIFCAHGGIPCSTRLIKEINEVKSDLKDPQKESAIAWEILWSDPIDAQSFAETAELLQVQVEKTRGFLVNTKRGTAFLFSESGANTFLQHNGLTHIVRAHEVPAPGYTFHFGTKCTTIFSSSHYCGNNNLSACLYVDCEKLRIILLDTVNNAPASD